MQRYRCPLYANVADELLLGRRWYIEGKEWMKMKGSQPKQPLHFSAWGPSLLELLEMVEVKYYEQKKIYAQYLLYPWYLI